MGLGDKDIPKCSCLPRSFAISYPTRRNKHDNRHFSPKVVATQMVFICSSRKLGKMNPFWRTYFSDGGLVQPPTRWRPSNIMATSSRVENSTTFRQSFRQNLLQAYTLSQKCRRLVKGGGSGIESQQKDSPVFSGGMIEDDWRWKSVHFF